MSEVSEQVESTVREWVDQVVVKLGLCPFAAPVIESEGLRVVVAETTDEDDAMATVLQEVRALIEGDDEGVATTMIVTPNQFKDFEAYLEILAELEGVLDEAGADHLIQIASFHPDYLFEDVEADDRSNYTNRSPFPIFHLLRQEDVEEALDSWREPMRIPERNIELLRNMSQENWELTFGTQEKEG